MRIKGERKGGVERKEKRRERGYEVQQEQGTRK